MPRRLTIVGGDRERLLVTRRGRGRHSAPAALDWALLGGPSTSPLGGMLRAVLKSRAVAGFCAVGCVLLVSLVLPYLALALARVVPNVVASLLFFSPQYLFDFRYVVKPVTGGFSALFPPHGALLFGLLLWGSVALGYGVVSQRLGRVSLWLIAPAVVVGVTVLVHVVFGLFGYALELDGP